MDGDQSTVQEHDPQAEDITASIDAVSLTACLFGAHVSRSTTDLVNRNDVRMLKTSYRSCFFDVDLSMLLGAAPYADAEV